MLISFDSCKFVLLKNTKKGEHCGTEAQGLLLCGNAGAWSSQCLRDLEQTAGVTSQRGFEEPPRTRGHKPGVSQ